MRIAERLHERRRAKGLTQRALADAVGVSEISIRRWETTNRSPDAEKLRDLARVLDTTVAYLTGEADNPIPISMALASNVNVNGENSGTATMTVAPTPPEPRSGAPVRWWLPLLQNAYDTADGGDQQQIADALVATRQATTVLERAVATA